MKVKTGKVTKEQLEKWSAQLENGELPEETLELVSGGIGGFAIFCIVILILDVAGIATITAIAAGAI
jgi:hypothetical protein